MDNYSDVVYNKKVQTGGVEVIGFYDYTVILTYISFISAVAGIFSASAMHLRWAIFFLALSGLCDMFDGKVARTKKNRTEDEKAFGIQIDSLCDLVSFGVLPAVIIYQSAGGASLYISGFYLLCAVIRLAWFNVDEEERQSVSSEARQVYYGLPVTTAALILPALAEARRWGAWPLNRLGPGALLAMGVAFLAPIPLKKPAKSGKIGMLLCGGAELLLLLAGADL